MDLFDIFGIERRSQSRCPVTIDGEIYFGSEGIPINIKNVSENGIGFEINKNIFHQTPFKLREELLIQFADNYDWEVEEFENIFVLRVQIQQIREDKDCFFIGGTVIEQGGEDIYIKYVKNKKIAHFVSISGIPETLKMQAQRRG